MSVEINEIIVHLLFRCEKYVFEVTKSALEVRREKNLKRFGTSLGARSFERRSYIRFEIRVAPVTFGRTLLANLPGLGRV